MNRRNSSTHHPLDGPEGADVAKAESPKRIGLIWEPGQEHMDVYRRAVQDYVSGRKDLITKEWYSLEGKALPPTVPHWKPDALLVAALAETPLVKALLKPGAPPTLNLFTRTGLPSVCGSQREEQRLCISHLRQQGYASLLFVRHSSDPTSRSHLDSWAEEFSNCDFNATTLLVHDNDLSSKLLRDRNQHLIDAIVAAPKPIGLICGIDQYAADLCQLAKELNLQIPKDFGLIALEDTLLAAKCSPPVSALQYPRRQIAVEAIRQLETAIDGAPLLGGEMLLRVNGTLINQRESTLRIKTKQDPAEQVMRYINEHLSHPLQVKDLAAEYGYTVRTLQRMFQEYYGISPTTAIRNARIDHAKELVANTALQITEIASRCGFSSLSHFNSVFKKATGRTPTAFRKQHRNGTETF